MTSHAIDVDQVTGIGVGAIVVVVVIGLIIGAIVTKIVVRVAIVVVVVVLGVVIWTQRSAVIDAAQDAAKRCNATFFGVHINPSDQGVRQACAAVTSR